jgi:hypothetical protein
MRFLIAAALFIVSVFLLLFGLAERTVWAPPANFSETLKVTSTKSLALIPNETLMRHPGNPIIEVQGSKPTFIASARESDIKAWIGSSEYEEISFDVKGKKLENHPIVGSKNLDSPAGADTWRAERVGSTVANLEISRAEDGAALIASDGVKPIPNELKVVWPINHDLTRSNIFLISGSVLLVAAFVMNFLAYQHMRKSRGPRRRTPTPPKPPRYKAKRNKSNTPVRGRRSARRAFIAIPAAMTVLAISTGCTVNRVSPSPSPTPSISAIEVPPVALTSAQVNKILVDTEKVAADADLVSDKKVLLSRFAGPALEQRTANYILRTRSASVSALPKIVSHPISFSLPAATNSWPRSLMVVTDEPGDEALPQMLVFEQETPRSKYMLWYNIRLMPGAKIPEVPASNSGAIPVEINSLFLKLAPEDIASAYGDVLNQGASSLSQGLFDLSKDEFYKQVSDSQKSQVANLKTGTIEFSHSLGSKNVISLSTSKAGALVAVYMTDTYVIKPKKRGSAVAVSGQEKVLLGADGSTRGVRSIYGDMMLFYVPALSDTAGIRLLGVTQGLVSVRSL